MKIMVMCGGMDKTTMDFAGDFKNFLPIVAWNDN